MTPLSLPFYDDFADFSQYHAKRVVLEIAIEQYFISDD